MIRRKDILEKENLIKQWIKEDLSKNEIARRLSCKTDTLNKCLEIMNIQYVGNKSGKGIKKDNSKYMPFDVYIETSENIQTNKIRQKLLKDGLKAHMCEICGNTEWNGFPIPLEIHHKDGNRQNNELDNLQILCPNCHAQTDTYRGRNRKIK